MRFRVAAAVLAPCLLAATPAVAQTSGQASGQASGEPSSSPANAGARLLFQPIRLHVDSALAPWVAPFLEQDHPETGRLSLLASEDAGSRSGQGQAEGDFTLFGRDFTLLLTQFRAGAWNGLPLWMNELAVHFAKPKERGKGESTLVVGVVGASNAPAAPLFAYRLAW